jgi:hypothetical protein
MEVLVKAEGGSAAAAPPELVSAPGGSAAAAPPPETGVAAAAAAPTNTQRNRSVLERHVALLPQPARDLLTKVAEDSTAGGLKTARETMTQNDKDELAQVLVSLYEQNVAAACVGALIAFVEEVLRQPGHGGLTYSVVSRKLSKIREATTQHEAARRRAAALAQEVAAARTRELELKAVAAAAATARAAAAAAALVVKQAAAAARLRREKAEVQRQQQVRRRQQQLLEAQQRIKAQRHAEGAPGGVKAQRHALRQQQADALRQQQQQADALRQQQQQQLKVRLAAAKVALEALQALAHQATAQQQQQQQAQPAHSPRRTAHKRLDISPLLMMASSPQTPLRTKHPRNDAFPILTPHESAIVLGAVLPRTPPGASSAWSFGGDHGFGNYEPAAVGSADYASGGGGGSSDSDDAWCTFNFDALGGVGGGAAAAAPPRWDRAAVVNQLAAAGLVSPGVADALAFGGVGGGAAAAPPPQAADVERVCARLVALGYAATDVEAAIAERVGRGRAVELNAVLNDVEAVNKQRRMEASSDGGGSSESESDGGGSSESESDGGSSVACELDFGAVDVVVDVLNVVDLTGAGMGSPGPCSALVNALYVLLHTATGALGGNADGRGGIYGELAKAAFQRVLDFLVLHCELGPTSAFMDMGSGLGKPNFHAAVEAGLRYSVGVEIDKVRRYLSLVNLQAAVGRALPDDAPRVMFQNTDITAAKTLDPFTHVYMFDTGFPPRVSAQIAAAFNASRHTKYLACFHRPKLVLGEWGLEAVCIGRVSTSMSGSSEGHLCFFYKATGERDISDGYSGEAGAAAVTGGNNRRVVDPVFAESMRLLDGEMDYYLASVAQSVDAFHRQPRTRGAMAAAGGQ